MQPFITRFAPSPNGYLHLGHAYSALTAYDAARRNGGSMLLRIDDIDTSRARQEYTQAIFEDLHWLGLDWPEPVRFQSQHMAAYEAAAARLIDKGVTYPCFCTRTSLRLKQNGHYNGACKALSPSDVQSRVDQGQRPAIRLNTQACPATVLDYSDTGSQVLIDPATLDNPIIVRKDIGTSYLFSCVVDDAAQNISHVVRGKDIQPLTPLQVLLQTLLDLPTPIYQHHALITDTAQAKLSKSKGSPSLRDARRHGESAAAMISALGFTS